MIAGAQEQRLQLRPARPADESQWRELWSGYCDFYRRSLPEHVTAATWQRILTPSDNCTCIVACLAREVVGFATHITHPISWSTAPAGYLEDLFVAPAARGAGIGGALIDHLIKEAHAKGWSRLYWMTEEDNDVARELYDRFTPADGFVRYVMHFDEH